ncbi:hypothetical protein [Pontibacter sp. G13]|uniref:hypothetical protein n=1 Tax=Pontibacter sp. G13 TaxID=3074898 RepID=UPI002889CBEA|nr:hypothetical protein [Pontibacter sp. G13]WNJ20202.1 hypothetical protein RJD25_06955 [Pontibacter sp. G13]
MMNKLTNLLLLLLIAIPMAGMAQLKLGIQGGYTQAWEYYGDVDLPDDAVIHINRYHVTGTVYWQISDRFSVGIEPGYVQRGAACVPGWMPIFDGDTKFFFHFASAPVMTNFTFPIFKDRLNLNLKAGYGASFLVGAYREVIDFNSDEPPVRTTMPVQNSGFLRAWDHGAYGGASLEIPMGRVSLVSGVDYYHGMVDTDRFNTSKNRNVNIYGGLTFTTR